MTQTRCLVCALLAVFCLAAPQARAQSIIPPELRETSSALSAEEDRLVRDIITEGVKELASEDPEQVMKARRRLIAPLELPNTSEIFEQAYSSHLKLQLADVLDHELVFVRLNAVIVLSRLTDRTAIDLLAGPLADAAPSVRYRAAKALGMIVENARYTDSSGRPQTERKALELITTRTQSETASQVWRPLLESLSVLEIPEARRALLDALDHQVDAHVNVPNAPLTAEHAAMLDVYRDIVESSLMPGGVDTATAAALARVAFRYLRLSSRTLAEGLDLDPAVAAGYEQMINTTDTILRWILADYLRMAVALPPVATPKIRDGLWAELVLDADKWQGLLIDSRLNLTAEQLDVPVRPQS